MKYSHSDQSWTDLVSISDPVGHYNMENLSEIHWKPKSRDISFIYVSTSVYLILLKFCTEHGSYIAMLCAKFQNDQTTEIVLTDINDFASLSLNLGWISHNVTVLRSSAMVARPLVDAKMGRDHRSLLMVGYSQQLKCIDHHYRDGCQNVCMKYVWNKYKILYIYFRITAWAKRRPFCMAFSAFSLKKICVLIVVQLKFVPNVATDKKSSLVPAMAWHQTTDEPLSQSIMTQFTDAYLHHQILRWKLADNHFKRCHLHVENGEMAKILMENMQHGVLSDL